MPVKKCRGSNKSKGFCRLAFPNEMTVYAANELHTSLKGFMADYHDFDLDLTAVEEIDTSGVQLLLVLQRHASASQGNLEISAMSDSVGEALALLGLGKTFFAPLDQPEDGVPT